MTQAVSERAVGQDGDVVLPTVVQETAFDGAVDEVVPYLVGGDFVFGQRSLCLLEIGLRKVADSNKSHFASLHKRLHRRHDLFNGDSVVRPVELDVFDVIVPIEHMSTNGRRDDYTIPYF